MKILEKAVLSLAKSLVAPALALALLPSQSWAEPAKVYKQRSDAVVLIIARNEGSNTKSKGTGSVVAPGYVLTNAHVVQDSDGQDFERVVIFLRADNMNDGSLSTLTGGKFGEIVAANSELDLALVKVENLEGIDPIPFRDSASVDIGSQVLAIGHPENGGLWSLTTGRIGSKIRNHERISGKHVLQTETPLNRGNSGGPLLNWDGELIGVNSSIARSGAGGLAITGVNFAIESDVASDWLMQNSLAVLEASAAAEALTPPAAGGNASVDNDQMNSNQSESSVSAENGSQQTIEQPTTTAVAPPPSLADNTDTDSTPAPMLTRPRSDGLLSKPRPYNDRTLFRAFAEQQMREFQGYAGQQQDAFQKFMERNSK